LIDAQIEIHPDKDADQDRQRGPDDHFGRAVQIADIAKDGNGGRLDAHNAQGAKEYGADNQQDRCAKELTQRVFDAQEEERGPCCA